MSEPTFVVATIWEYIEPIDRGDRYEDPLDEALSAQALGEVCGGGTQLSDDCGIESVDIEIELNSLAAGLDAVRATLEKQGAPKGSVLKYEENGEEKTLSLGVTECVAVFLDGVSLPDEVYQKSDINVLAEQMISALGDGAQGEIRSAWPGPEETALFLFGIDAEAVFAAIQPVLESYPLGQNARVVIRHGKDELSPRTVRIPKRDA